MLEKLGKHTGKSEKLGKTPENSEKPGKTQKNQKIKNLRNVRKTWKTSRKI